jgi:hypothetical protein
LDAKLDRTRTEIMARIDRLQDELTSRYDDGLVPMATAEGAEKLALNTREEPRGQLAIMFRRIHSIEGRLTALEQKP